MTKDEREAERAKRAADEQELRRLLTAYGEAVAEAVSNPRLGDQREIDSRYAAILEHCRNMNRRLASWERAPR